MAKARKRGSGGLGVPRRRYDLGYSLYGDNWNRQTEANRILGLDPNRRADQRLEKWIDRTVYDPPQMRQELNVLPPQEQQQWLLNNRKQLEEMFRRFQFGPERTSR